MSYHLQIQSCCSSERKSGQFEETSLHQARLTDAVIIVPLALRAHRTSLPLRYKLKELVLRGDRETLPQARRSSLPGKVELSLQLSCYGRVFFWCRGRRKACLKSSDRASQLQPHIYFFFLWGAHPSAPWGCPTLAGSSASFLRVIVTSPPDLPLPPSFWSLWIGWADETQLPS